MNQIIKFAPQIRSEKDKKDFAFYVYAFTYLLDFHHTDEDDLVFPLWEAKGIDMQSFKDEHVVYHKIIQELKSISQGPVGEFSAQQVQELCLQLKATLTPHLKAEEQLSNRATFERHGFTGQDLDNLTAQILEKVKLQDRSIILPLILFQITPFEYENFVGLKFPWILRKVIFPFVIAPKHKDSWRFCWNDPRITTPSEFSSMEEYCTDLTVIHNTLRRSINQLIINAPLVAASNQADVTDYLQFMHAVLYFLHSHHSNEDDIIFPVMAAHGIDIAVFKKDQKVLADILHNLQEIGASQFNLSTTLPLLESLKTQVVSRFQAEEVIDLLNHDETHSFPSYNIGSIYCGRFRGPWSIPPNPHQDARRHHDKSPKRRWVSSPSHSLFQCGRKGTQIIYRVSVSMDLEKDCFPLFYCKETCVGLEIRLQTSFTIRSII